VRAGPLLKLTRSLGDLKIPPTVQAILAARIVTVLDVDGDEGRETLRALELGHGELPETPVAITGSGGAHYYFTFEEGLQNAVKFAPGLDVRTEGGLVVGVGSKTTHQYQWEAAFSLGALRMVLMRDRRAEQSEDAVAGGLHHITVVAMRRLDHQSQRRIDDRARLFGIEVFHQFGRTLDVREQRRHRLAFTLDYLRIRRGLADSDRRTGLCLRCRKRR
jgi:hypothetical protein